MKLPTLQQSHNNRRSNNFRSSSAPLDGGSTAETPLKSPSALFWLLLHGLCCLVSLVLGFRFSRLVFFLLFSSATTYTSSPLLLSTITTNNNNPLSETLTLSLQTPPSHLLLNRTGSRVVVGRHGIRIRPWPHPNPTEVMMAHRIIDRVQQEQRIQYGIKNPRPVIVITPTYVRTFQAVHLTGLMHTLMLVPYDLTWLVVEAGGVSNETAAILDRSQLQVVHVPFDERMPAEWSDRHRMEARMRLHALRVVRERRLDGIVVFADDSNMHSLELFDEIQSVKWMGAVSVGILAHSGNSESLPQKQQSEEEKENLPVPIQGPACNSSDQLAGWHTFNSLPYVDKSATFVGDGATVLPGKLEWSGFVLNSRLVWKEAEDKPDWVRDLDSVAEDGEQIESPLALVTDESFIEPLGKCGKKVLLWWLRVEARSDSKFPPGWIIDPPLEITVPAKRTPWPDAPPELPSDKMTTTQNHLENSSSKPGRASRSRHSSRSKRKHESRVDTQVSGMSQAHDE